MRRQTDTHTFFFRLCSFGGLAKRFVGPWGLGWGRTNLWMVTMWAGAGWLGGTFFFVVFGALLVPYAFFSIWKKAFFGFWWFCDMGGFFFFFFFFFFLFCSIVVLIFPFSSNKLRILCTTMQLQYSRSNMLQHLAINQPLHLFTCLCPFLPESSTFWLSFSFALGHRPWPS